MPWVLDCGVAHNTGVRKDGIGQEPLLPMPGLVYYKNNAIVTHRQGQVCCSRRSCRQGCRYNSSRILRRSLSCATPGHAGCGCGLARQAGR